MYIKWISIYALYIVAFELDIRLWDIFEHAQYLNVRNWKLIVQICINKLYSKWPELLNVKILGYVTIKKGEPYSLNEFISKIE